MCGIKAVQAAVSGEAGSGCAAIKVTNRAAGSYASESFITPLASVAKVVKVLSDEFIDGDNGITTAFRNYAAPLIGEMTFMTDLAYVKATPA